VETQAGDISSYIPTNVISITDGQVFLDSELFNSGFRPAIDVGLSVSRVGGSAQSSAVRKVSGRLRLDLAQYREMAAFAQFGSDLDKSTQDRLSQGERLMEVLKQAQFSPLSMAEQVAILHTAVNGFLMDVGVHEISAFVRDFLEYLKVSHAELLNVITETGATTVELEHELGCAAEDFKASVRNSGQKK
jgi:F-type H+-transporting ATPase subunit alpha